VLITGAAGFIGLVVVENLLSRGFRNLRCFTRSKGAAHLENLSAQFPQARVEVIEGNLLSRDNCTKALQGVAVVLHLAAGRGEKLVPDAYLNSVVTTRNLLDACVQQECLKRFVSISSFTVYTNAGKRRWRVLDESCPTERRPELRGDAYTYAKVKQDELVAEYGKRFGIPFVLVRPGYVYGRAGTGITGRVGSAAFGLFLHLGGATQLPLSYVDNCADAIVLAALEPGVEGETFNVVDDDLPSSRRFLRLYKKRVRRFKSIYIPKAVSYLLCFLWERYSQWSEGQLPLTFNRRAWHAFWKTTSFSNEKIKRQLGWTQRVATDEALKRYFDSCRTRGMSA